MNAKVFVDVYSWVSAVVHHGYIPFEGIYRHAHALAREFTPVVYVRSGENTAEFQRALKRLEIFIVKEIQVFTDPDTVLFVKPNIWLSIALDSPSPILPFLKAKVWRVAVLHDTLAYEGFFGASNQLTFEFGARNNDMLLPVSDTSLADYKSLALPYPHIHEHVKYGCFHTHKHLPQVKLVCPNRAVSLGTVYPRKRFVLSACVARKNKYAPHHIGRFVRSENDKQWEEMIRFHDLTFHGYKEDQFVEEFVSECEAFFMLSEREGFSMTPMEAILLGVPKIYLSPIAVHKEVYGDLNVNWVTSEFVGHNLITEGQRIALFKRWSFSSVIADFKKFIS